MKSEPITETFKEFIRWSERLIDIHMQRAAVNDGLAGLSDIEIHHKAWDVPTKIKAHLWQLNLRLKKQNVKLNEFGELDFSKCEDPKQVEAVYKKNPTVAWIALML